MPKLPLLRLGMALLAAMPLSARLSAQEASSVSGLAPTADERINQLSREVADLKTLVMQLQDQLRKALGAPSPPVAGISAPKEIAAPAVAGPAAAPNTGLFGGTTMNVLLDGYYEWNSNSPVGRANYLRAYDVSSNSFSLNQADVVLESAPDLNIDKRYGARLDLQFGQATSTLQGNPANELRPDVYRNVFQAYGTYIFPVAAGLTFDFGKWASSLGLEGNYTKDQLNYSRSFLFDFLPFYHTGLRSKLALNDQLALNVWITNGTEQTEAFNNYKDQMFGILFTPTPALSWTMNYYQGQEHPDVIYEQIPTQPNLPYQQGRISCPSRMLRTASCRSSTPTSHGRCCRA